MWKIIYNHCPSDVISRSWAEMVSTNQPIYCFSIYSYNALIYQVHRKNEGLEVRPSVSVVKIDIISLTYFVHPHLGHTIGQPAVQVDSQRRLF